MKKLNYKQVGDVILQIKENVPTRLKLNVFRAIKEFLLEHKDEICSYDGLYFIGDKGVYNIQTPQQIQPLPGKCLFCGWADSNDDTYHYWLKDKKHLHPYGISYEQYKGFCSRNWFITQDERLYIDGKYYKLEQGEIAV